MILEASKSKVLSDGLGPCLFGRPYFCSLLLLSTFLFPFSSLFLPTMPYHEDDDYNSPYTRPPRAHKLNTHAPGNEERALEAKLVVMGNTGVGKTSLVTRYTENTFNARLTATTGAVFVSHKTEFAGFQVKLQIWDTAGMSFYRLLPAHFSFISSSPWAQSNVMVGLLAIESECKRDQSPPFRADWDARPFFQGFVSLGK